MQGSTADRRLRSRLIASVDRRVQRIDLFAALVLTLIAHLPCERQRMREHAFQLGLSDVGRPSIDPELMIRMLIVGYCSGIRSERRLAGIACCAPAPRNSTGTMFEAPRPISRKPLMASEAIGAKSTSTNPPIVARPPQNNIARSPTRAVMKSPLSRPTVIAIANVEYSTHSRRIGQRLRST